MLGFLQHVETTRHNQVATRNQRLAGLRTFFEYVGRRLPEMLPVCEHVAMIATKRTPRPETRFLNREESPRCSRSCRGMGDMRGVIALCC